MTLPISPQEEIVKLVGHSNKRDFMLFLGAGASISSGVPGAGAMIREWKQALYEQNVAGGKAKLAKMPTEKAAEEINVWFRAQKQFEHVNEDNEYSVLFENYRRTARLRQRYIESKIEGSFPSWGYLYLSNILNEGYFNIVFTTNFDDLLSEALATYLSQSAMVCSADSEVATVTTTSDRPKIIKLHGDYLFELLKNTRQELERLDPNMEAKLREFARDTGLVVIGYGGHDRSVMRVLEELLKDPKMFPLGVYWGVRAETDGSIKPAAWVSKLATEVPDRFQLFECPDFDLFMVDMHTARGLPLPDTIIRPFDFLRTSFARLTGKTSVQSPVIQEHMAQLQRELDRPWAQTSDTAAFDLLQAQMALGRREHAKALQLAQHYAAQRPADANGLAVWGDALCMAGDVEQSQALFDQAVEKWQAAIRLDPKTLSPRYSLARLYIQRQETRLALAACEELVKLAPDDRWLRRQLAAQYSAAGRAADALREIDWLIARESGAADLYAMKAFVLSQRGLVAEAGEAIKEAVRLSPSNAYFRVSLAGHLASIGRFDLAAVEYEQAIQLDPSNLGYRLQITNFYWMKQQPQAARPHMEAAVKLEPASAEVRGWLGQIYFVLGMLDDAGREMEEANRLNPGDGRTLVNLGLLHAQRNRPDLAEQYWRQGASQNPSLPQPHVFLAQLYFMQNRMAELNTEMQVLMQIAPALAQQLGMQLQTMRSQPMNAIAALQAQWASMFQAPGQNQPPVVPWQAQGAGPAGAQGRAQSFTDLLRSALQKMNQ
jgi:tetratricopeptide (TPR) repeat protein